MHVYMKMNEINSIQFEFRFLAHKKLHLDLVHVAYESAQAGRLARGGCCCCCGAHKLTECIERT